MVTKYDVAVKNVDDNVADVEVNGTKYSVEFDRAIESTKTPKLIREQVVPSTRYYTVATKNQLTFGA